MNYEKKYNTLLEMAKKELQELKNKDCDDITRQIVINIIHNLFPELKENENEKIRKSIIAILDNYIDDDNTIKPAIMNWLEKQGNIDKASYEIAEKEKDDFVSAKFIDCKKSFNEFKEGNSYWLEYIGNDTYVGRSDDILNEKFHITPKQLYSLFTQQHYPNENNVPTAYGKYVDECLNEAAKHFLSEGEDKYSIADLFYAGINCEKSWLEKQGEQTSLQNNEQKYVNKIEPKFHKGNWVVLTVGELSTTLQIVNVDTNKKLYWFNDATYLPIDDEECLHLWTIQDAKDGDILASEDKDKIFLYNGKLDLRGRICAYCGIYDGLRFTKCAIGNYFTYKEPHPATKEQQDLLFEKMKEAGYKWDSEKKCLTKM